MTATPGIPDGMSFADLQALIETAQSEDQVHQQDKSDDEATQSDIEKCAHQHLAMALEVIDDPLVHKVMLFQILSNFVDWHNKVAHNKFEDGEIECAAAWLRDAGKFQACMNILSNVTVGPDDFTCE